MTTVAARLTGRDVLIVSVLGTVTFSGPLAVHFFLPAVPLLQREFGVGPAVAQAAFSITLFVMALSTLAYGSLADRLGRRLVLAGGLALFVAGSILCALSGSMASLIVGRLVQAVGAGCGLVLSRAIAHDLYAGTRVVRILAYLTMAYSLGPMIAPPIGGFLVDNIGWRAIFAVAAAAAAATLALALLVLPNVDHREGTGRRRGGSLLAGYARLFGNARFCGFVFQSGFGSGAFFAYAGASTFLMHELLHRPPSEYGVWFMLFPLGYWLGTLIASRLGGRVAIEVMVAAGAGVTFLAAATLAGFVALDALTPPILFVPGLFVTLGQGMSLPNAQAGAIGTAPALAGTAAGIGIFLQLGLGAALAQLTGVLADGTAYPMAAVVLGSTSLEVVAGLTPLVLRRRSAGR